MSGAITKIASIAGERYFHGIFVGLGIATAGALIKGGVKVTHFVSTINWYSVLKKVNDHQLTDGFNQQDQEKGRMKSWEKSIR